MGTFPGAIPVYSNPSSNDFLNSPGHAAQHANNNDDTVAIATKVGTGDSTPAAGEVLVGDGPGSSSWQQYPLQTAFITDGDAATVTFDLSGGNKRVITIAGNRIFALSNVKSGHIFIIKVIQGGTGSNVPVWFSTVTWRGTGGVTPTPSTTVGAVDIFGFIQTGANAYDGFVISLS